jgi:tetratricopeptide (TPR) repeat protein
LPTTNSYTRLLGTRAEAEGRIEEAKQCYEQNLAIARNVHDRRGEGLAHFHLGQVLSLRGEMESAEGSFRRALDLLRGQETITYAEAALVFGSFLMRLGNRHKEGCEFIAESIRLSVQMELPGHKEASARAVQFGCGEPRSVGDCRS